MKRLIVFVVLFVDCVFCYGEVDANLLGSQLRMWIDELTWTEGDGFFVAIRKEVPPYIFFEGDFHNKIPTDNGVLRLKRGKRYLLTLGRGVFQRLRYVDPLTEATNSVVYSAFGPDVPLLYFEHSERVTRDEDPVPQAYVISAYGEVYDVTQQAKGSFKLPYVGPVRKSMFEKVKEDVCDSAKSNVEGVRADLNQVRGWVTDNHDKIAGVTNVVTEVCYFDELKVDFDSYERVINNPAVSEAVRERLQQSLKNDQRDAVDVRRWARLRISNEKVEVESIRVGFKGGVYRLARFNQDGRAESVLYFTPRDEGLKRAEQKMLYGFDDKEELVFFLHLIDGKGINSFLVREQNGYVESKDEARAKKLIDEVMMYAHLFRCEK